LGRAGAEIAIGLKVEVLQVITRVPTRRRVAEHLARVACLAPLLDPAEIGKEAARAAQPRQWVRHKLGRQAIVARGDVAPVTLEQPPEIAEDTGAAGASLTRLRRAVVAGCRLRRGKQLLTPIPRDAQSLRR